jgi:hypothetical protein
VNPSTRKPIVLCPLRFELKQLQRGLEGRFDFICTGPGEVGIRNWARHAHDIQQPVILAGLAGSLTDNLRAGSACIIDEVVEDKTGSRWRPTLTLSSTQSARDSCVITSSHNVVAQRADRLRLQQRLGAHLIDFESVAFARTATELGLQWAIIRGISDDLKTGIFDGISTLVDDAGRTRPWHVFRMLASRPTIFPGLFRLGHHSRKALAAVRILIGESTF